MPKCGGSSFNAYLHTQYPPDRILTLQGGRRNREILHEFNQRSPEERHAVLLTIGHGASNAFPYLRPDTIRVTCFREPVERIVSLYRYIKREPKHHFHARVHAERLDLDGFLQSVVTRETRNFFTQQLSGLAADDIDSDPAAAARAALEGLARNYDIAGSLDRFDAFVAAVRARAQLGDPDGDTPRANAAPEPIGANALPSGIRSRIEDMNRSDILFFKALETRVGRAAIDGSRCQVV